MSEEARLRLNLMPSIYHLILFLSVLNLSIAQSPSENESKKPEIERMFQFFIFQKPENLGNTLHVYSNGKYLQEMELYSSQFSRPVPLMEKGELTIHLTDKKLENPEELQGYPSASISEEVEKFIILGYLNKKNKKLPLKFSIFDSSTIENGDYMLINFLDSPLRGFLGNKKVLVPSKKVRVYKDIAQPATDFPIRITTRRGKKEDAEFKVMSRLSRYNASYRTLLFFYQPKNSRNPKYTALESRGL